MKREKSRLTPAKGVGVREDRTRTEEGLDDGRSARGRAQNERARRGELSDLDWGRKLGKARTRKVQCRKGGAAGRGREEREAAFRVVETRLTVQVSVDDREPFQEKGGDQKGQQHWYRPRAPPVGSASGTIHRTVFVTHGTVRRQGIPSEVLLVYENVIP